MPASTASTHRRPGFTLIEVMMVVTIIGILVSLTIPLTSSMPDSKELSGAADNLNAKIAYGRLLAVSSGQPVELRFYQKPVTSNRSEMYFRATQMLTTDAEGRFRPDGRIQALPGKVILSPDKKFSSILAGDLTPPDPNAVKVGNRLAQDLRYTALRFRPDGSTNLGRGAGTHWTLTLVNWKPNLEEDTLPSDFVTLQIDPFNAKVRRYEPGQ